MMAEKSDLSSVTPLLFNLVDLTLACLRSHSQQTIHVTLQLVSAILKRHHRYAVLTLLRTESLHDESSHRTTGAHDQEVEYLMTLAGSIGGQDNFDEVYDNVLKDAMTRLESHPCSLKLVAPKVSTNNHELPAIPDSLPGAPPDVKAHTLQPDDPLLTTLLDILEKFFINPVDTNLSVTETLTDLAICGYMGIEGWMLRHPKYYSYDEDEEVEEASGFMPGGSLDADSPEYEAAQRAASRRLCRKRPRWESTGLPRLLVILKRLCDQVAGYRESVPRFDDLLQQRREAFQTADSAPVLPTPQPKKGGSQAPASHHTPDRASMDDPRSDSPARPSALEGFAQRLLSELGTPSRSGSPRGRKEPSKTTPSQGPSGLSGGYGIGTPTMTPTKGAPVPPKEFPLNYDAPSRSGGVGRSYSPGSTTSGRDDYTGKDPTVASQMAAFAAIDQSILARRVGIPGRTPAVPLDLGKTLDSETSAPVEAQAQAPEGDAVAPSEGSSGGDEAIAGTAEPVEEEITVSVSHVLTNALILQSFLMELAGLIQVRAGLFNEVRFV